MSSYHREEPYGRRGRDRSPVRNDRRGGPMRDRHRRRAPRSRNPDDIRPIDRSKTSPLFIKLFIFEEGRAPEPKQYESHQKDATELHIHTWIDTTLIELKNLIKKAVPELPDNLELNFHTIYTNPDTGDIVAKKLGAVSSSAASNFRSIALDDVHYFKGDPIYVSFYEQ